MKLEQRIEQLEAEANKTEAKLGHWARQIATFYGEDAPLVWVEGPQTLADFYSLGLPGLDEMYEQLPEEEQSPDVGMVQTEEPDEYPAAF